MFHSFTRMGADDRQSINMTEADIGIVSYTASTTFIWPKLQLLKMKTTKT